MNRNSFENYNQAFRPMLLLTVTQGFSALIGLAGVCVVGLFALDREIWKLDKE